MGIDKSPFTKFDNGIVLKIIPFLIFISYVFFLSFGSNSNFPEEMQSRNKMPFLADKPIGEDAFYMLTISKNFASGKGLSYNFNKKTTGIQPLATIIYAVIYKVSYLFGLSDWTILRLLIIFNSILIILLSITLYYLASQFYSPSKELFFTISILTLFNFGLFRTFTYGLETGLYLLLFAFTVKYSLRLNFNQIRFTQLFTLSFLIGITTLARIDFGVVIFVFLLILYFTKKLNVGKLITIGFFSGIIILPWFLYVFSITGSFIPSSGGAQSSIIGIESIGRVLAMFGALIQNANPWLYNGGRYIVVLTGLLSLFVFVLYFRKYFAYFIKYVKNHQSKNIIYAWLISILFLIFIYIIFFWASHFYYRYSTPISIFIIVFFGLAVSKSFENKSSPVKYLSVLFLITVFFIQTYVSLHRGVIGNNHTVSAGFIPKHFSSVEKIGVFQSGVIGYFNPNVINLDGKIDNDALSAIKNKSLNEYIDINKINVLIDWSGYIYGNLDSNYIKLNWSEFPEKINNNASICLVRKSTNN